MDRTASSLAQSRSWMIRFACRRYFSRVEIVCAVGPRLPATLAARLCGAMWNASAQNSLPPRTKSFMTRRHRRTFAEFSASPSAISVYDGWC